MNVSAICIDAIDTELLDKQKVKYVFIQESESEAEEGEITNMTSENEPVLKSKKNSMNCLKQRANYVPFLSDASTVVACKCLSCNDHRDRTFFIQMKIKLPI